MHVLVIIINETHVVHIELSAGGTCTKTAAVAAKAASATTKVTTTRGATSETGLRLTVLQTSAI